MDDTNLVTGSTANLGNQVVRQLSSFDRRVCAAVQLKNRAQEIRILEMKSLSSVTLKKIINLVL